MTLQEFLTLLADSGQPPIEINTKVSPEYELGAVLKKLENVDNRTVKFNNVGNSKFPVITNLFGTDERIALAFGFEPGAGAKDSLHELHKRLKNEGQINVVDSIPAHANQIKDKSNMLGQLPIGTFAQKQTAPYINSAVMIVRDPDTGNLNTGIYRMMKLSENQLTVSVDPGHDLGKIISKHQKSNTVLDYTLVIGASPQYYLSSQAKVSLERDVNETYAAIADREVQFSPGITNDLLVPYDAEIVIEGFIEPNKFAPEGPYGEFSYYYGSDPSAVVCDVSLISHKDNALYLDIHPVHNDHRSLWLHPGREESLLRRLRELLPSVVDVAIPREGAGMQAIVSIDKKHEGDPRRALTLAMVSDMFIKHAIITDADVDIRSPNEVLWAMCTRFQPHLDTIIIENLRGYSEDPSGYSINEETGKLTSKIGYDATRSLGGVFPEDATGIPEGFENLNLDDYLDAE